MELYWREWETGDYNDGLGLDLDEIWAEPDVIGVETLKLAILWHIAVWCVKGGYDIDKVEGFTLDSGGTLNIHNDVEQWAWLDEVCEFYVFIQNNEWGPPEGAYFAWIENVGWKWFNFNSDLDDIEDNYRQEFDGDYEAFAKEWMSELGEELSPHLENHFDYDSYGEELVNDFDRLEWDGQEYLFHQ